jgi:small subunit ribosomal protein S6
MRRYETIYILRPNLSEDEITRVVESTNQIILDENGTIIELNKWGMKKLAYLIKKENQGYYVYCEYAGTPAAVAEIERKFRIDDAVLRYITIKTAASISSEQIEQAVGEVTARETASQELTAAAEEPPEAEETTEQASADKTAQDVQKVEKSVEADE